jgi:hypothetical protein
MTTQKIIKVLCFLSLACMLSQPVSGQVANPHYVIGSGGGSSSGGGLRLDDTIGEAVIGVVSQGSTVHKIGFRYVATAFLDTSSTAVFITAFGAEYTEEGVILKWEIGHSDDLKGFNIYRSMGAEEKIIRLNDALIPAEEGNTYVDHRIRPGKSYSYQLGAVDRDGEFYSQVVTVDVPYRETTLEQNYPNPFNPSTTIAFFLAEPSQVELVIYNVQGKRIKMLLREMRNFGKHTVKWDGRNDHGSPVSSGVYYYRMKAGKQTFTKKLTLLK